MATKAVLSDVPALAWTSALAFTRHKGRDRTVLAALDYLVHFSQTLAQYAAGSLYHQGRVVMVGIENYRAKYIWARLLGSLPLVAVVLFVMVVLPDPAGEPWVIMVGMLITIALVIHSGASALTPRARQAERSLKAAIRELNPSQPVYIYTQLARRLSAPPGSAQALLGEVLDNHVPDDALVCCTAAEAPLVPVYQRFGLEPIGQSLAMITPEPRRRTGPQTSVPASRIRGEEEK